MSDFDIIIQTVSEATRIPANMIRARGRHSRKVTDARQLVMAVACDMGFSLKAIGAELNRHHATVIHGRRNVAGQCELYADAAEIFKRVRDDSWSKIVGRCS